MTCKHGEWHEEDCELCRAEDAAYDRGYADGLRKTATGGKDQAEQFRIASRLLVEWMAGRPNPHLTALVTGTGAELLSGECTANRRCSPADPSSALGEDDAI